MTARRSLIRKAVQQTLLDQTEAGPRVYTNQSSEIWDDELPVIVITTRSETLELLNTAPREYKRAIDFVIEIVATGGESPETKDTAEDLVDKIAEEVENKLSRDDRLGSFENNFGETMALVDELVLSNIEFEYTGEGIQPMASARMAYRGTYYEYRPFSSEDQGITEDFEQAEVDWKNGQAADSINT